MPETELLKLYKQIGKHTLCWWEIIYSYGVILVSHFAKRISTTFEINASKMFTWRLNRRSSAAKLSKRSLWPSHFHLNGSVESHLLAAFLQHNRLNKSQWADENRKTSLLSYTNSIWFAQCGCTWQHSFNFICSSESSCPLTIWAIMKFPSLQVSFVNTLLQPSSSVLISICTVFIQQMYNRRYFGMKVMNAQILATNV